MKGTTRLGGLYVAVVLLWAATAAAQPESQPTSQTTAPAGAFDHGAWNTLLSSYVVDGSVNYSGLKANAEHMALLDGYVASLATAAPTGWSRDEQLAFWINAYNALVVDKVVDLWPLESVIGVDGFFDRMEYTVAGESLTLNRLEDSKIRVLHDPRIHFALNCAAVSCPPLRAEAFVGGRLEEQLEEQTRNFVRSSTRLDPDNRSIYISKLFEWFNNDFQGDTGGHRAFLSRYMADADIGTIRATTNFFHFDEYDWSINGH